MTTINKILLSLTACALLSVTVSTHAQAQLEPRSLSSGDRPIIERHFQIDPEIRKNERKRPAEVRDEIQADIKATADLKDLSNIRQRFDQPIDRADMIEKIRQLAPNHQTEIRAITQELKNVMQAQDELLQNGIEDSEAEDYARDLQTDIQNLQTGLKDLHRELKNDNAFQESTNSVSSAEQVDCAAQDCYAADASDESELDGLADIESELAYREEIIAQLLEQLSSDGESSSSLEANLLAIQNNPVAAGGIAIFVLVLLWLFRGRIAELSGFGVKVSFKTGTHDKHDS